MEAMSPRPVLKLDWNFDKEVMRQKNCGKDEGFQQQTEKIMASQPTPPNE